MPLNGHGTEHVMPGRCMSPSPLLVFVSCVLFVLVPFCFFVVAFNLVSSSLYDPLFWARVRVSSLFVVESNLPSPFLVLPMLCGHARSTILLGRSVQPSSCWVLFSGINGQTNSSRMCAQASAKCPQRIHMRWQAFPSIRAVTILV